jgi:5'-nucleotidase
VRRLRLSLTAALAIASSGALIGVPAAAAAAPRPNIPVQLIAMNDFHGRIQNTSNADAQQITAPGSDGVYGTGDDISTTVGGSANVATTVKQLRSQFAAQNRRSSPVSSRTSPPSRS